MKYFKASIPVLKIMGSDSMARLVGSIFESAPAEIVPNFEFDTDIKDSISTTSTSTSLGLETTSSLSSPASNPQPKFIDWDAESTPPAGLAEIAKAESSPLLVIPPRLIVTTDVTGHLGAHLLQGLLNDTAAEIHCLDVRKLATRLQNKELPVNARIQYHEGDLADPLLGLSEAATASIFARADAVIHNGAETSHAKLYGALRASEVGSTATLPRFCLPRSGPLHYVSSAGVCIFHGRDSFPPVPVTGPGSLLPAPDGSFGYASSKWVSERLLERVHAEHGLPVCIYRPSTIMRRGTDATSSRAELDWVNALLWYTRRIGAAPQVRHNRGALDLVRTETCCDGGLGRVLGGISAVRIEYVNQVGDAVIPMASIRDVDADKGRRYDVLPLDQWLSRAVEAGLHPGVSDLIRKMDAADMPSYPRLLKE